MQGFCYYCDVRFSFVGMAVKCEFRIENVETVEELIQLSKLHNELAHNG